MNLIILFISLLFLMNCGLSEKDEPGLYYLGENPLVISVGDTAEVSFKRIYTKDLKGRLATDDPYIHVTLESADSGRVGLHELQVIGIDTTVLPVTITADDDSGNFYTTFQVEVESRNQP